MTDALANAALAYEEPNITTILVQSSLLVLSNLANHVVDRLIYCGLIAQILLGIAWGEPGGNWLGLSAEETISQLGYIGLLLLVYEGGLGTDVAALKSNLLRSVGIALTGIVFPIGLSFILLVGLVPGTTPVQAFAAGASLCSTSLGTTFTILKTTGMSSTRLGVVLTSAAMIDDIVGLVMVQIITAIGDGGTVTAATVIRPIFVAIAFAGVVPLCARFVIQPVLRLCAERIALDARAKTWLRLTFQVLVFYGLVVGTSYAGTSNLLGAYLAGALARWYDDKQISVEKPDIRPCLHLWELYYESVLNRILKPFFFASIGFSIPISHMFEGSVVWRGIVFTVLMLLAKLVCGVWLVSFDKPDSKSSFYPVTILATAMVARGEIGFLISSLAFSNGIFPGELYLVVTWAIALCTIIGPVSVGYLVKKTQKLDRISINEDSSKRSFGNWGIAAQSMLS